MQDYAAPMRAEYGKTDRREAVIGSLRAMAAAHPLIRLEECGDGVPMVTLGSSADGRRVLYVGGLEPGDMASTLMLLRFTADYVALVEGGKRLYGMQMRALCENRAIGVIPMAGGAAFCENPASCALVLAFDADEDAIRCQTGADYPSRNGTVGRMLADMAGSPLFRNEPKGGRAWALTAACGMAGIPAFCCGCRTEGGADSDRTFRRYAAWREALFSAPILV